MISISDYTANVDRLAGDYDTFADISAKLGKALDKEVELLGAPGKIEAKLRQPADKLDLPDATVKLLGFIPKFGTALKTIANIADTAGEEIGRQADIMGKLDDAWAVPRGIAKTAQYVNLGNKVAIKVMAEINDLRLEEAHNIADSLEGDLLDENSRLAQRMEGFNDELAGWFAAQDGAKEKLDAAVDALEAKLTELAGMLPETTLLDDAVNAVNAVFGPIKSAMSSVESKLKSTWVVYQPAVKIGSIVIVPEKKATLATIISNLDAYSTTVQNKVKSQVESIAKSMGIDFEQVIADLKADLLSPLDPVFALIEAALDGAQDIIDALKQLVDNVVQPLTEIRETLESTFADTLFDNHMTGDHLLATFDDVLTGTDGEDGIFGLLGNDTLKGGKGDDFIFGGVGDDNMNGGADDDDMYGGAGNDRMVGGQGDDMMDGGSGNDRMFGMGGNDRMTGGDGNDRMVGGKGRDTMQGDDGNDRMFGGDGVDTMFGGDGDDLVSGGDNNDMVLGGRGNDRVSGGDGNDIVDGGKGRDVLSGGEGRDQFVFHKGDGRDRIVDFEDGVDLIDISSFGAATELPEVVDRGADAIVIYEGGRIVIEGAAGLIDSHDFKVWNEVILL